MIRFDGAEHVRRFATKQKRISRESTRYGSAIFLTRVTKLQGVYCERGRDSLIPRHRGPGPWGGEAGGVESETEKE